MIQSCLVIGAGLAGLVAARHLQKKGCQVTLLEKSKGVGGRLATRRIGEAVFDHGAQFFSVHSMFFRILAEDMQDAGVIQPWSRGFLNAFRQESFDGYLRFRGTHGMTDVAKFLAQDLSIRLNEKAVQIEQLAGSWRVTCESGHIAEADALMITAPLPQALALLEKNSNVVFADEKQHQRLSAIKYEPCIALMVQLDGPTGIPEPGAIALNEPTEPIQWIADNRMKGISTVESVTVHATPHFSRKHYKNDKEENAQLLWAAVQPFVKAQPIDIQVHNWLYSQPAQTLIEPFARINDSPMLLLAGDAFGEGVKVEAAVNSGLAAAKQLLKG
jgi:predicted NAD/FAD-dependent oxidoreductase